MVIEQGSFLEWRAGVFSAHHSMLRAIKPAKLSCGITHCKHRYHLIHFVWPCGEQVSRNWHKNCHSQSFLWHEWWAVFLCALLPAALKCGCLTCLPSGRQISYPVQFLTVKPSSGFIHNFILIPYATQTHSETKDSTETKEERKKLC